MGKRVKKKAARSALKEKEKDKEKEKRVASQQSSAIAVNKPPVTLKERKVCVHLEKSIDLAAVSSKIESAPSLSPSTACEYCRDGKPSKGKGKHTKKKGAASDSTKATWICLQCGHFSCGGVGLPNNPLSHALKHTRETRHPLVIQVENPHLRWCFSCSALLPVEEKDAFEDIVNLLKKQKQSSKVPSVDVEEIWFGSGSGSVLTEVKSESKVQSKDFYAVRGLVNLGNTCFFNSVMQNLLAMDVLREYLFKLEGSMGPLTNSFKKVFVESCPESGMRGTINPKPLFGCICAKAPQFRGYQQQDSHELLRYLLDGLSSEFLNAKKSASTMPENRKSLPVSATYVDDLFGGQMSSTVCCLECGHSSVVYEPFLDLSLPVPTKKSPSKKVQPVSRTKKTKLPPKRAGRTRPKLNKNGDLGPAANGCDTSTSTESSSGLKEVFLGCAPSGDLAEPSNGFHGDVLVTQGCNSLQQDFGSAEVPQSAIQDADGLSWLDFVEPPLQSEDAQEADSFAWLDFVEPVSLLDDSNVATGDEDFSVTQDLGSLDGNHDTVSMQETAKESVEASLSHITGMDGDNHNVITASHTVKSGDGVSVHHEDVNLKSDTTVDDWGDECPMMVQDNEILLLTYKEDDPTEGEGMKIDADVTASTVVDGEDILGFDGLGDLFNEPEAVETGVNNILGSESLGNGILVGNNTESDPDEVDDTDSPVSVESCLAHFMKPELLSGDHAWHCENCSKLLKEKKERKKMDLKKAELIRTNLQSNVCSSSEVLQANNPPFLTSSDVLLATHSNGSSDTVENLNKLGARHSNGFCRILPSEDEEGLVRETAHLSVSGPVCLGPSDETNLDGKSVDSHELVEKRSGLSEEHKLGKDEDEEVDLKCIKVMSNATKRLLISKTPPILTIHLKRFGQDVRGRLSKLNGHVVFKEFLDLGPYLDCRSTEGDKCLYHLVGVVEHSGSMRGGHYVAYIRGGDRRKGRSEIENTEDHSVWYHASDSYVRKVTLAEVLCCEAYILFYEKVEP